MFGRSKREALALERAEASRLARPLFEELAPIYRAAAKLPKARRVPYVPARTPQLVLPALYRAGTGDEEATMADAVLLSALAAWNLRLMGRLPDGTGSLGL